MKQTMKTKTKRWRNFIINMESLDPYTKVLIKGI